MILKFLSFCSRRLIDRDVRSDRIVTNSATRRSLRAPARRERDLTASMTSTVSPSLSTTQCSIPSRNQSEFLDKRCDLMTAIYIWREFDGVRGACDRRAQPDDVAVLRLTRQPVLVVVRADDRVRPPRTGLRGEPPCTARHPLAAQHLETIAGGLLTVALVGPLAAAPTDRPRASCTHRRPEVSGVVIARMARPGVTPRH